MNMSEPMLTSIEGADLTFLVLLSTLVLVIGLAGNLFIIYVFAWRRRKCMDNSRTSRSLLLTLALLDLVCSATIPLLMIVRAVGSSHHAFVAGCKVMPFALTASVSASQVLIITICYDRYQSVAYPHKKRDLGNMLRWTLSASILLSFSLCIPMIIDILEGDTVEAFFCYSTFNKSKSFLIQSLLIMFRDLNTFIIMVFFIKGILRTLNTNNEKFNAASVSSRSRRKERLLRIRRILAAVVTAFKICIVPYDMFIFFLMTFKFDVPTEARWQKVVSGGSYLIVLQSASSAVNIFIYAKFHPDFGFLRKKKGHTDFNRQSLTSSISGLNALRVCEPTSKF